MPLRRYKTAEVEALMKHVNRMAAALLFGALSGSSALADYKICWALMVPNPPGACNVTENKGTCTGGWVDVPGTYPTKEAACKALQTDPRFASCKFKNCM